MTPNTLSFLALCNEYCAAVENASQAEDSHEFAGTMLRLLPRIYISASDLTEEVGMDEVYIDPALEEDYYESVRRNMESVLGEGDGYLDTFQEDMKYSDTPIGASISENLADLFQVFYNLLETVREAPAELASGAIAAVREEFPYSWSGTLCNALRALNHLYYNE